MPTMSDSNPPTLRQNPTGTQTGRKISPETYRTSLRRLEQFAQIMDTRLKIPVLNIRFGLDAIIGLVPGIGNLIGLLISLYALVESWRLQAPKALLGRMLMNVCIEFVVGVIPVVGDAFDVYWKANRRNVDLLRNHIEKQLEPPPKPGMGIATILLVALTLAMILALLKFLIGI